MQKKLIVATLIMICTLSKADEGTVALTAGYTSRINFHFYFQLIKKNKL